MGRYRSKVHNRTAEGDAATAEERDRGFTLVELVCAIVLIALIIVPLMDTVMASVRASSANNAKSNVETALRNAADRVNRAPGGCNYLIYAQAAVQSQGWDGDRATVTHKHYVPNSDITQAGNWVADACEGGVYTELLVQMVTITITSPSGQSSGSIEVIKSNV